MVNRLVPVPIPDSQPWLSSCQANNATYYLISFKDRNRREYVPHLLVEDALKVTDLLNLIFFLHKQLPYEKPHILNYFYAFSKRSALYAPQKF